MTTLITAAKETNTGSSARKGYIFQVYERVGKSVIWPVLKSDLLKRTSGAISLAVKKSREFSSLVIYLYKGVHYLSKTVYKRVRGCTSVPILRS